MEEGAVYRALEKTAILFSVGSTPAMLQVAIGSWEIKNPWTAHNVASKYGSGMDLAQKKKAQDGGIKAVDRAQTVKKIDSRFFAMRSRSVAFFSVVDCVFPVAGFLGSVVG